MTTLPVVGGFGPVVAPPMTAPAPAPTAAPTGPPTIAPPIAPVVAPAAAPESVAEAMFGTANRAATAARPMMLLRMMALLSELGRELVITQREASRGVPPGGGARWQKPGKYKNQASI